MESPFQTISYQQSSKIKIVETDDPEITLLMSERITGVKNAHILMNPTPTADELARETPKYKKEGYKAEYGVDTGFYLRINHLIQLKTSEPTFFRAGMLSVNIPSGRDEPVNHCIFFRELEEQDGSFTIFIYDANDQIGGNTVNYRQAFTTTEEARRKLRRARFVHPLSDLRDSALNEGYGRGVCQAISFSLSRLWGKIEEQMRTAAVPRRATEPRSFASVARFDRTRNKFDELLASPNITAKVLIRAAMGATYDDIVDVANGVSRLPGMRSAYANLRAIAEGKKDEDDVERDEI